MTPFDLPAPEISRRLVKHRGPRRAAAWAVFARWPGRRTAHRIGTIEGRRWRSARAGIRLGLTTRYAQCLAGGGRWPVAAALIAVAAGPVPPRRPRRPAR